MTVVPQPAPGIDPLAEADVAARLRLAVTRLHRLLRQQVAGGLTPSQISALASAARLDRPTLGELAAVERVQPPSMTRMVVGLERAGLLERLVDPADGRVVRAGVTAEGRRTLQRIRSLRNAVLVRRLSRLTDAERRQLADLVPLLERLVEGP